MWDLLSASFPTITTEGSRLFLVIRSVMGFASLSTGLTESGSGGDKSTESIVNLSYHLHALPIKEHFHQQEIGASHQT